jgi:acyl-CoA-binding protein
MRRPRSTDSLSCNDGNEGEQAWDMRSSARRAPRLRLHRLETPFGSAAPGFTGRRLLSSAVSTVRQEDFMRDLDARFEQALTDVKKLPEKPGNMTLLRLYALFKQATEGDAHGEKPGFTDFVGKYKYDAWASLEGTAQEQAKEQYVELVESLKNGAAT